MDVPVVKQRQVPMVQKVQKTMNIPQVQYNDKVGYAIAESPLPVVMDGIVQCSVAT